MSRRYIRSGLVLLLGCYSLSLTGGYAKPGVKPSKEIKEAVVTATKNKASTEQKATEMLGGSERYLTAFSTDKPIYKLGENVYFRGVMLSAKDHKPFKDGVPCSPLIEIKGPKGDVVARFGTTLANSTAAASWNIPSALSGGEYKAKLTFPGVGYAPAERKFDIRAFRAPRLNSQITFLRDGYGPGDTVTATLDVKRAEGGVPAGAKVTVDARVDGNIIEAKGATVDEKGLCRVSFNLPKDITRGEGTLALVIADGGVVETASKTIPILLKTVDLQMYPEGGDLVAGFKNRVYFQARQTNGKPADLVAKLMRKQGSGESLVTELRSEHEGRGRFEFTPEANGEYFLKITEPSNIAATFALPAVKGEGAVLKADKDVYGADEQVSFKVGSHSDKLKLVLSKREAVVVTLPVNAKGHKGKDLVDVRVDVPATADGVLIATLYDGRKPVAERLVFRQPQKGLNITVTADRKHYIPGDRASVTIKTTDSDGKPVSAVVGMTATDTSVLEMVEKREQAPHLPVMVFLEPEVKDLADAAVYLNPKDARASLATDLLLGTQGWRRFAFMDTKKFIEASGDSARRVVAVKESPSVVINDVEQLNRPAVLGQISGDAFGGRKGRQRQKQVFEFGQGMRANDAMRRGVEDIGRVEGPRDVNLLQVEPSVLDERHFSSGRAERHQKTSPTLPEGAPIPDADNGEFVIESRHASFPQQYGGVMVREYAHPLQVGRVSPDRHDFTDTIYWSAGIPTDATTGEATVSFGLNDSVTSFKVSADAFTADGGIGTADTSIESVQPFYAEAKIPLEVTAGDQIMLPVSMVNGTDGELSSAGMSLDSRGDLQMAMVKRSDTGIGAGARLRFIQPIIVGKADAHEQELTLTAHAGSFKDKVVRKIAIRPQGFPTEIAVGGVLEPGMSVSRTVTVASSVAPGSMSSNLALYPTPLANMTEAMQRLILDPCGCFEQTSSTSYPLTMAQQYFLGHAGVDPRLIESSRTKLDDGYKKLVGFWCPDKGYEWFGENPGHEALTAFGLLHFHDMQKVREVDQKMVESTRAWLLAQRDGNGGFTRKRRALHTWIEDKDCSNAYIVWALLECGQPASSLQAELASLKTAADKSTNNYVVALAANAFYLSGDKAEALKLADRLAAKQKEDGSVDGVTASIVGSGGDALEIEGTSLATLAWLREPKYNSNVQRSIKFLADACKAGRYGSTQSTVLALRCINTYDKQRAHADAPGKVRVLVDGQTIGDWVAFDKSTMDAIKLPDISEALTPGDHKIELRMEGGSPLPYSLAARYNALTPASDKDCKLKLSVKMAQDKVAEGASTEANVNVVNTADEVIPNPVAIVGLPGGLEIRHQQLKELVKKGVIDAYEVRGREVVLYWRTLPANANLQIPLSAIAAVPGTYTGPASCSYLYYTDEHKVWADGVKVEIAAK